MLQTLACFFVCFPDKGFQNDAKLLKLEIAK